MKQSRITAILLAMVLVLGLTACGDKQNASTPTETDLSSGTEELDDDVQEPGVETPEDSIDYYLKVQDPPVDDGSTLSNEEVLALEVIQFAEPDPDAPIATIKTSKGDIRIVFYPQYAPLAVENFLTHAQNGYYDGLTFHRVIEDFMIQGGDPNGNGTGGQSIYTNVDGTPIPFQNESNVYLRHFRGALAMANSGMHTNGSQFFIVQSSAMPYSEESLLENGFPEEEAAYYGTNQKAFLVDYLGIPENFAEKYVEHGGYPSLDGGYTVFGMVIEGMDVVDAIAAVETNHDDNPLEAILIESITVENA